ncbi:hypothetical protein [Polaromonas sp.]|uniref:hypothetical protein n=1 Tax=Polaromonas sp. TaxID=1869339 RepID=UPI00286CDBF1|nr:hypothetical protein [Polaromonas sp.]
MEKLSAASLRQAGEGPQAHACHCALGPCPGWESFTEERWPKEKMRHLGSLRDPEAYEPGSSEYHPDGTRYDSPDAPVAVDFYPYNRCEVHACDGCGRVLLRYTEFGGYYVDHRMRQLDASLVV